MIVDCNFSCHLLQDMRTFVAAHIQAGHRMAVLQYEEVEVEGNDDGGGGAAEGGNEEAADAAARSKFKVSPWLWWFRPWNAAMAGTEFEFVLMLEDMPSLSSWRKGEG